MKSIIGDRGYDRINPFLENEVYYNYWLGAMQFILLKLIATY